MSELIQSLLSSPVLVAIITGIFSVIGNYFVTKKDFLRLQILTLLQEERLNELEKKPFSNTSEIDALYDKYTKLGGNSYIKGLVERYHNKLNK